MPITVVQPGDSDLPLRKITAVLADIGPRLWRQGAHGGGKDGDCREAGDVSRVFPFDFCAYHKGIHRVYRAPHRRAGAFTVSVKQRYNHLARLAVGKGLKEEGYLFKEDCKTSKENAESFASLRAVPQGDR